MTLDPDSQRAQLVRELLASSSEVLTARLRSLEEVALHLLTHGGIDDDTRAAARRTAHQLISLSAFGVPRGAELAGRAEALLSAPPADPAEEGAELAELTGGIAQELRRALDQPTTPPRPAPAAPAPAATTHSDVLVVEDDPLLTELLERALEGAGHTVRSVSDGAAALAALSIPAEHRPRLVLLDIDLPALDGFGVLRALAGRGLLPHIPVLCLTARASEPDVLEVLKLGAVDHVAKPFSLPVLLARVARVIRSR